MSQWSNDRHWAQMVPGINHAAGTSSHVTLSGFAPPFLLCKMAKRRLHAP